MTYRRHYGRGSKIKPQDLPFVIIVALLGLMIVPKIEPKK